jgi:hypothetical protein
VESLIERFDETSPYTDLFGYDYVALKRINAGMNPSQAEVIKTILAGPPALFTQAFELETSYLLPDGDTVYLYHQRYPLPVDYPVEYVTRLAESMADRTRAGDAIVLTPPELIGPFVSHYSGQAEVYLAPATEGELADIAARHRRIFLILGDAATGDVQGLAQDWLTQHTFRAGHQWSDSLQLITYGTVAGQPASTPAVEPDLSLGDAVRLAGYDLPGGAWHPGDIVPLVLFWQGQGVLQEDYQVFVHLLGADGQLVAQTDSAPLGGLRPTSSWQQGETVVDHQGLLLPDTLPYGQYELRLGMYRPADGQRLVVTGADGQSLGDNISLGTLTVMSP